MNELKEEFIGKCSGCGKSTPWEELTKKEHDLLCRECAEVYENQEGE